MPQYLKRDMTADGCRGSYTILQTTETTEAYVAYRCSGADGRALRLVHYQNVSPMQGETRERYLRFAGKTGLIPLRDYGKVLETDFDVFPAYEHKLDSDKVSISELAVIVRRLGYLIVCAHYYGLLIRDICPGRVYYDPERRSAGLDTFANVTALNGRATATKAPASGISPLFIPPEVETAGWSVHADFYALGITALLCLRRADALRGDAGKGQDVRSYLDREVFRPGLGESGYAVFTAEQKIHYLIAGLTLPDPRDRWGYREILCWGSGEYIPLVQSGKRRRYDMYRPFAVGKEKCWDYDQLAVALAAEGKRGAARLPELKKHLDAQNPALAGKLEGILKNDDLTEQGKLFYAVYTLYPGMDGFRWDGKYCRDTAELIKMARSSGDPLEPIGEMLRNRCFSFLHETRGLKTAQQQKEYGDDLRLEQWEQEEKSKGAARFIMQKDAGHSPSFPLGEKSYSSLRELLTDYSERGGELKKRSRSLLEDRLFAAWLWSKGYSELPRSDAGTDEEAFLTVLLLCEKTGLTEDKKLARRMFMRFGPYPYLTWLRENLSLYTPLGPQPPSVAEIHNEWSDAFSIDELNGRAPFVLANYHDFVRECEEDPFASVCGLPSAEAKLIRPKRMDAFFSCVWNGESVTPAFLIWIGDRSGLAGAEEKAKDSYDRAVSWLNDEKTFVENMPGVTDGAGIYSGFGRDLIMVALNLLLVVAMTAVGWDEIGGIVLLPALVGAVFPVFGIAWAYKLRGDASAAQAERDSYKKKLFQLQDRLSAAEKIWCKEVPAISESRCGVLRCMEPISPVNRRDNVTVASEAMPDNAIIWFYVSGIAASMLQLSVYKYEFGIMLVSAFLGAELLYVAAMLSEQRLSPLLIFLLAAHVARLLFIGIFGYWTIALIVIAFVVAEKTM